MDYKKEIAVIGLGTVGEEVFKEISKKNVKTFGIDVDKNKISRLKSEGYATGDSIYKNFNIYIICVYYQKDIINVVKSINYDNSPLVCIESTISPETLEKVTEIVVRQKGANLVLCPHRYNENDKNHHVFNQARLIAGATEICRKKGKDFYLNFIEKRHLIETEPAYAVISKLTENAYRFIEIAIAEELSLLCKRQSLDFEELRRCANTKWNIGIREARKGIYGSCLTRDTIILDKYFENNQFLKTALKADKNYKTQNEK
ncbi:MAG: NAD(P)-binding domain-containing protein [Bacteroidota bacterium]